MNNPNPVMAQQQSHRAQQAVFGHYNNQQGKVPPGWQQTVSVQERASHAWQLYQQLRILSPEIPDNNQLSTAIQLETAEFNGSPTREAYVNGMARQQQNIKDRRQAKINNAQGFANGQNLLNQFPNGMNPTQMAMMGQPGMQGLRPNAPQQFPQPFPNPQLQRQMQTSPLPGAQPQSMAGINGANPMNFPPGQGVPPANMQQLTQQHRNNMMQQFHNSVQQLTKKLMQSPDPAVRAKMEQSASRIPPEKIQASGGVNALVLACRFEAENMVRRQFQLQNAQGGQVSNPNGQAVQHPGQPTLAQMNPNQRPPNQGADFNALAEGQQAQHLRAQQMEALRVQDQGTTVVPASDNPNLAGPNAQQAQVMAQRQALQAAANNNFQPQNPAQVQQIAQARARAHLQQQQQQQQQHLQQQQQHHQQAQVAQRNPSQMLQGQVGGLNMQPGPSQSPAMTMLTRPMVPPGQPGSTTPQQRPQAHVPQMTATNPSFDPQVPQLMREAQQRAAVAQQGQVPLTEHARNSMLPPNMPDESRQKLLSMPEANFRQALLRLRQQMNANSGSQPSAPNMMRNPSQPSQMGVSGQMMNGQMNGQLMNGPSIGGLQGMPLGPQTPGGMANMGNMNNPQLVAHQRQLQLAHNHKRNQAQDLLRQNPGIIQLSDNSPFSPQFLKPQVKQTLPADIKTWAQLKNFASQNPNSGIPDQQELLLIQVMQFQDFHRQRNAAGGQALQPNGVGTLVPPNSTNPGQRPAPTLQQQQMGAAAEIQVSQQEIQAFRARMNQPNANITDEQVRNHLGMQKLQRMQQQQQQAHMMQLQGQRAQAPQPPPSMPGPVQQQISRPPTAQSQPAHSTPQPKVASKAQLPVKLAQPNGQNMVNRGVKRSFDDSTDTNETAAINVAPQAPAMVPSRSQQGVSNLTQEQISKLPGAQATQVRDNLLKAQDASNARPQQRPPPNFAESMTTPKPTSADVNTKLQAMMTEEDQNMPRGQPVQYSPESRNKVQETLRHPSLALLHKLPAALGFYLLHFAQQPNGENTARKVIRARIAFYRNVKDDLTLCDELTLNESDLMSNASMIIKFIQQIMHKMQQTHQQQNVAKQNQQMPNVQPQVGPPAQLNAHNLKLVEQQHQRQQKAPPAPVTDRPPFPLGGQSPRGAPTYFDSAPKVENLRLPDKKKPRLDYQVQTPGAPAPRPSPRIGTAKDGSPDLRRQQAPSRPVEQKPSFKCVDADCDYSIHGFDTQAKLEAHKKESHHVPPDALQFVIDAAADATGVDPTTGQPRSANRVSKPPTGSSQAPVQPVKAGQTPIVPQNVSTPAGQQAAATPMARVPTLPGLKNSPSTNLLKTPQMGAKGTPAKTTPASATKQTAKDTGTAAAVDVHAEQKQPAASGMVFSISDPDLFAALDYPAPLTTMDVCKQDDSWLLRGATPAETPETDLSHNTNTPSTRASDISPNDNLIINLDVDQTVGDEPDAWMLAKAGADLALEPKLSDDIDGMRLGTPPWPDEDLMLFQDVDYAADAFVADDMAMWGCR